MVQYNCDKCNKNFDKKDSYLKHLNRITPCVKITDKIELIKLELLENYNNNIKNIEKKIKKDFEIKFNTYKIEKNKILQEQNNILIKTISDMQTEQKNLINRLNALETFIIKNININNDFINDELQNGGAIEGLQFENQLSNELKKYNINVYFDKEITKKYGKSSAGVDIVIKYNNNLITLQCKREIKLGSLKDVNHFIIGSQIIEKKENIKPKLYWISKVAPNKSALESLELYNITIITDINSKNCLKKCIDNIKKDMDIKDEILKK